MSLEPININDKALSSEVADALTELDLQVRRLHHKLIEVQELAAKADALLRGSLVQAGVNRFVQSITAEADKDAARLSALHAGLANQLAQVPSR